ncbi:MAG TPA: Crp/Fnr family transcriptional regulator [Lachnospiraceae bacterium]|nr:Crp/Fnr family transcriptional regulator [Lachnospiraceae bacterium]HCA70130.1 Crp/Fnr family transcriptional regulator [Lachnospiraceae bacterium]HCR39740.1 Crp/Fnr family transcriptional regulator [Lachnospiraceae bacterium]
MRSNMEKYNSIIKKCALFRNIEEKDYEHLLGCLSAKVKSLQADEYLFFAGDEINYVGIVLEGIVEIMKENLAGNKHIVAFLEASDMFAEGTVCTAKRISPVTARVKEDSKVLLIPYERITKSCGNSCPFHISLIQNMMVVLGEKNVNLNRKLELLTLKGMREKIASFLLNEANERGSSIFQIVLNRTELADYLNVSRTSMCRELARMKAEGMIDYYGRSFKILHWQQLVECLE